MGNKAFNVVTYTGNGSTQSITGVGFQPDFVWIKSRSNVENHATFDVIRGVQQVLRTNTTQAENTAANTVTSFDSDGFTTGTDSEVNFNGWTYVAWCWKANGTGVSNTNGSITSTVSANVDAGFSIVSYTGNGTSGASIGHGLSSAPDMVIYKSRNQTAQWNTYHASLGFANRVALESTAAADSAGTGMFTAAPTSSVFYGGGEAWGTNNNGITYIAYAFHSVEGYSKVGSYTGNGSTDGTFVHCGFRPKYVLIKSVNDQSWNITDTARLNYNLNDLRLLANSSAAEEDRGASDGIDMLSNGFKLRSTATIINSANNFIYIAFAETPFKYSNAR